MTCTNNGSTLRVQNQNHGIDASKCRTRCSEDDANVERQRYDAQAQSRCPEPCVSTTAQHSNAIFDGITPEPPNPADQNQPTDAGTLPHETSECNLGDPGLSTEENKKGCFEFLSRQHAINQLGHEGFIQKLGENEYNLWKIQKGFCDSAQRLINENPPQRRR